MQVTSVGPQAGLQVISWLGQTTTVPPPTVYKTASCSLRETVVFFVGLALSTSSLNTADWSWVWHSTEAEPIWLVQSPINLIGQGMDIQSKSSHSGISSLGFFTLAPETKPRSSLIHGSSRCKAETWRPGAVGGHSLGKWRQEGNWVMAESLMWEVPKPSCCLHLSYDFWLFNPTCSWVNKSLSAQAGSSHTLVLNNQKVLGLK